MEIETRVTRRRMPCEGAGASSGNGRCKGPVEAAKGPRSGGIRDVEEAKG